MEGSFTPRKHVSRVKNLGEGAFLCHSCISWYLYYKYMSGNISGSRQEKNLDLRNFTTVLHLSLILLGKRWGGGGGCHLSLRTIILTENQGERGRGHLSLGTKILTENQGEVGRGSFVSRNNYSNCRTRERGGSGHLKSEKKRTSFFKEDICRLVLDFVGGGRPNNNNFVGSEIDDATAGSKMSVASSLVADLPSLSLGVILTHCRPISLLNLHKFCISSMESHSF